jgi:hypothetical protein
VESISERPPGAEWWLMPFSAPGALRWYYIRRPL